MSDHETLIDLLHRFASETPRSPALIDGLTGADISYARLRERVEHLASGLVDAEVKAGDTIVVFMESSTALIEVMLAATRIGAISLPLLGPDHKPSFVDHARKRFAPKLFIFDTTGISYFSQKCPGETWREIDDLRTSTRRWVDVPPPQADDVVYWNFSSGTTSTSKIVPATHRQIVANARACAMHQKYRRSDIHMCTFRLHPHDLFARALVTGAASVLLPAAQDNPKRLAATLVNRRVTCLMSSPMTLSALELFIERRLYGARLRIIECGGGSVPDEIIRSVALKTGARVILVWGSTETNGVAIALAAGDAGPHHSIGSPLDGYSIALVDEDGVEVAEGEVGELVISGVAVAHGYVNDLKHDEPARLHNGKFRTGDRVRRHRSTGHISIVGRAVNSCKVCGAHVNYEPIERAILSVTSIRDVVVVPRRHYFVGNILIALYVADHRANSADLAKIRAQLDNPLFEMPRAFLRVDAIPYTAAGKVDRIAARSLVDHRLVERPWSERTVWRTKLYLLWPKVLLLLWQSAGTRKDFAFSYPGTTLRMLWRAFWRFFKDDEK